MSETKAREMDLELPAKIREPTYDGLNPAYTGLGPIPLVLEISKQENLTIGNFSTIEMYEARASQVIGSIRELNCEIEALDQRSGITIWPPFGSSVLR